jgi:hypothetical protein
MSRVSAGLEEAGRLDDLEKARSLLHSLGKEFQRVRSALGTQLLTSKQER